jgi:hypothetical protein
MLKRCVLILGAFTSSVYGFSQSMGVIPPVIRSQETMRGLRNGIGPSELLYGIPLPPGELIGDGYLSLDWRLSSVMLYRDEKLLEGYLTRYDISGGVIEFKTINGVKIINGNNIKSLVWIDTISQTRSYLVNAKEYTDEDSTQLTGFFEVLADGKLPLFKKTNISIKLANYVPQFDMGTRDDVIQKLEIYYCAHGDKVSKVQLNKKKVIELCAGKETEIKNFIKTNSLDVSQQHHLQAVFERYNLLVKE